MFYDVGQQWSIGDKLQKHRQHLRGDALAPMFFTYPVTNKPLTILRPATDMAGKRAR